MRTKKNRRLLVRFLFFLDLVVGVQHCRVVASAEELADGRQAALGELAAEVHGDLPREGDATAALFRVQVLDLQFEVGGDDLLDDLERDFLAAARGEEVLERFGDDVRRHGLFREGGVGADARERALELTDVRVDAVRDGEHHVVRHLDVVDPGLAVCGECGDDERGRRHARCRAALGLTAALSACNRGVLVNDHADAGRREQRSDNGLICDMALLARSIERRRHDAAAASRRARDDTAHDGIDLTDTDGIRRRVQDACSEVATLRIGVDFLRVTAREAAHRVLFVLNAAFDGRLHDLPVFLHLVEQRLPMYLLYEFSIVIVR